MSVAQSKCYEINSFYNAAGRNASVLYEMFNIMVTLGTPDQGPTWRVLDYWFAPGTRSHIHVSGSTGEGRWGRKNIY